ncbi:50S ribosomal protein L6 [Candidatus Peregrinibacteria bacterium CG10_big_fil_rev_8_21_14_0_10_36_19]|nr:MAG: 50S ribosomal protein L6 [Candidatus Peregrinibacteria bacterium CG10_big_fil_rev_8_21_14_0_10_36_19]
MSRIGKQPVVVPNGVEVKIEGNTLTVKGPKGELTKSFHPKVSISHVENEIIVNREDDSKECRALHGLTRSLINGMVEGVSKGFEKKLEIIGVGYRATAAKQTITLSLGFSHPIEHKAVDGVEFEMHPDQKNVIIVRGIDKQKVGEEAAKVRGYKKPEPYKGKGIKYADEIVARKAGKSAGK